MPEAVIVSTARSPIGRAFKGSLIGIRADDLTVQIVQAALAQVPELPVDEIEDLLLGCGLPEGEQGLNLGRNVALLAGYDHLPATTVTRYCASSLQSTRMAMHAIRAGEGSAYISAGVEMVSRLPAADSSVHNHRFADAETRTAMRAESSEPWADPRAQGLVPDAYIAMGQTAENVQQLLGISRTEQDEFAALSQQRAAASKEGGFWAAEITPITLPDGSLVTDDDSPRDGVTVQSLAELKPVFRPDGTVTAGNACPLNDGAAAVVIMSDTRARELGLTPLARIVSTAVSGISPEIMGLGPVEAARRALAAASLTVGDIDLFEINEAFAVQVLGCARELGIEIAKLNVHGGAIALGHPFGMTGARITTTLLHGLQARDVTFGLETMCVGGGMGVAMVVERLN